MANGYRNALVQQIKDAGQELINRAESMVHPENDLITDFSIVIHFEQHEVPTIGGHSAGLKVTFPKCLPGIKTMPIILSYTITLVRL